MANFFSGNRTRRQQGSPRQERKCHGRDMARKGLSRRGALARIAYPRAHPLSEVRDKREERVILDRLRHVI